MKKYLAFGILILFLAIQLIRIDKSVPETNPDEDFLAQINVDPTLNNLIVQACYDCHSYRTEYPWYSEIAPVSWWIKGHINHGRESLNFSIWGQYDQDKKEHKLEECVEKLDTKSMPLKSFTWLHPEAKLTNEERDRMMAFFESLR